MIRSELRITPHYSGNSQPPNSPSANSCASPALPNETEPRRMTASGQFGWRRWPTVTGRVPKLN